MDILKTIGALAGVLALVLSGFVFLNPKQVATPPFGGFASPDVSVFTSFHSNMLVGGYDFATSSQGAATYTAASLLQTKLVEHTAAAALTLTLPTNAALSSAGYLPNPGDTQTFWIHATTTKITLAGSTGVTLYSASSTKDVAAGSIGEVRCVRLGATEARLIECLLSAD